MNINWEILGFATKHYTNVGYEYIEVPWLVKPESNNITKPPGARTYETFRGELVASGEQSLLDIRHKLTPGKKYQCVTPCFRHEEYDELHHEWFIKNELMLVLKPEDPPEYYGVLEDAAEFFNWFTEPEAVTTDIGVDLFINGIEVGSYGYREFEGFRWIYGTGVAEPRLSQAIEGKGLWETPGF